MHVNAFGIMAMAFLGLMGGLIGAYFSIKNTNGPRERAFMLKVSIVAMVAVSVFVGLLYVLPNPYRFFLWVPYAILLPLSIVSCNRTQQRIRLEESQERKVQEPR